MREKKESALLELLSLFSSTFLLGLLLFVLYYALDFLSGNFPRTEPINAQMFYTALIISIVTSLSQWIEGRIKAIIKSINTLKKAIIKSINTLKRRYTQWKKKKKRTRES